jgi:cell division protein ZapA
VKRSVSVTIAGVKYSLKTDEDERYVKSIAAFVDGKIREAQKHGRTVDTQSVAVLTAMQIAEELFTERRATRELRKSIRERSQSLLDYLEREARV